MSGGNYHSNLNTPLLLLELQRLQILESTVKMATILNSNSEAGFIFASLVEFLHLWRSGRKASMNIECMEGSASLSFNCNLGHPDTPHIVGKQKKWKRKSKNRAARDNARAARHQSGQGAVISPSPGGEAYVAPSLDQPAQLVSEEPTVPSVSSVMLGVPPTPPAVPPTPRAVPIESSTPTTPKRPATSPTESLSKRPAISSPSPDPSKGPKVQLPVWDSTHSPEILREGNRDQDDSIIADLPSDTERHESDYEVEDGGEDESNGEDDKDEVGVEDENGKKDDSSEVPVSCDCSHHYEEKYLHHCLCSSKMMAAKLCSVCQYREALRKWVL